uniref:Uncharacterized protein n=1 Tax=Anguilla anguilla TaxID=7936 RepID=A0A0E9WRQ1_ANGAN
MNFDETTMFLGGNTIVGKRYHTIHTCSRKVLKIYPRKINTFYQPSILSMKCPAPI